MFKALTRQLTSTEDQSYVIDFRDGSLNDTRILGIKGAELCEMTHLQLPVPEGFVLTTTAWHDYKRSGHLVPDAVIDAYQQGVGNIERSTNLQFGVKSQSVEPLLLAVRCGSSVLMPGLMNSVLNVGMNLDISEKLEQHGSDRFALDTYRRFLQSYGVAVNGLDGSLYQTIIENVKTREDVKYIHQVSIAGLRDIVGQFRQLCDPPQDPWEQLDEVIRTLLATWESAACGRYRAEHHLSDDLGIAIVVQRMVLGNFNSKSGCGVCFSHHVNRGEETYAEFLRLAEGREVTEGARRADAVMVRQNTQDLRSQMPDSYADLLMSMRVLEERYGKAIQYAEFAIEDGRFFLLETNAVKALPRSDGNRYLMVLNGDDFQHA